MNDSFRVCRIQSVGNLDAQIEHRFDLQGLACNLLFQRLAFEHFHHYECSSIDLVNFVDRADVGMVQGRGSASLTAKPLQRLRVVGKFFGKELEGDETVQLDVLGLVDHTHAAAADLAEDAVMRNRLPHGLEWGCHWREY